MADHEFAFQPQFLAQGCPLLGVEGELFQIDGIVEDPELRIPVEPAPGGFRTGTELGGVNFCERAEQILDEILLRFALACHRVIVHDTVGHPGALCSPQREHTQRIHVRMDDLVLIFPEQLHDRPFVLDQMGIPRHQIDVPAQPLDLLLLGHGRAFQREEVKLDLGAVDVAVIVHHDHLDAAIIHICHHLGDPNRRTLRHVFPSH